MPHSSLLIFTASSSFAFSVACPHSGVRQPERSPRSGERAEIARGGTGAGGHLHVRNLRLLRRVVRVGPAVHLRLLRRDVLRLRNKHAAAISSRLRLLPSGTADGQGGDGGRTESW